MLYQIQAQVVRKGPNTSISAGCPTFYLDSNMQGIESAEHAANVALRVVDPFNLGQEIHLTAYAVDPVPPTMKDSETYFALDFVVG